MAMKIITPHVGMYVYVPYGATNPGKIKQLLPQNTPLTNPNTLNFGSAFGSVSIGTTGTPVEVAWHSGKVTIEDSFHLSDFNALIADHQKKLNTHTSKIPRLQSL